MTDRSSSRFRLHFPSAPSNRWFRCTHCGLDHPAARVRRLSESTRVCFGCAAHLGRLYRERKLREAA